MLALGRPGPRLDALAAREPAVTAVPVDWDDLVALRRTLPNRYRAALLYCPTAPLDSVMVLGERAGSVVHLLTSDAAAPERVGPSVDLTRIPAVGIRLLLGWHPAGRWHTPQEISTAAIAVFDGGGERILGRLRPWAERPC